MYGKTVEILGRHIKDGVVIYTCLNSYGEIVEMTENDMERIKNKVKNENNDDKNQV